VKRLLVRLQRVVVLTQRIESARLLDHIPLFVQFIHVIAVVVAAYSVTMSTDIAKSTAQTTVNG
jgi:hypothetical protein